MHCVRGYMGETPKDPSWAQRPQLASPTAFRVALTQGRGFQGEEELFTWRATGLRNGEDIPGRREQDLPRPRGM